VARPRVGVNEVGAFAVGRTPWPRFYAKRDAHFAALSSTFVEGAIVVRSTAAELVVVKPDGDPGARQALATSAASSAVRIIVIASASTEPGSDLGAA
jgi:hypothetical protein